VRGSFKNQACPALSTQRFSFWLSSILPVPYESKHMLLTCTDTVERLKICMALMKVTTAWSQSVHLHANLDPGQGQTPHPNLWQGTLGLHPQTSTLCYRHAQ
jgi:hypothetical protein